MRLTEKDTNSYKLKYIDWTNGVQKATQKLGLLEDIEEDLGIDLVKLLSAKEIYFYQYDEPIKDFCIDFNKKTISDYFKADIDSTFSFDDYGKYWAFTKEEIKNDRV